MAQNVGFFGLAIMARTSPIIKRQSVLSLRHSGPQRERNKAASLLVPKSLEIDG